jgi:hypothetical protein
VQDQRTRSAMPCCDVYTIQKFGRFLSNIQFSMSAQAALTNAQPACIAMHLAACLKKELRLSRIDHNQVNYLVK